MLLTPFESRAFPNIGTEFKNAIEKNRQAPSRTETFDGFKFGIMASYEFKLNKHRFGPKWRGVIEKVRLESDAYMNCDLGLPGCDEKVGKWRRLLQDLKGMPANVQLQRLNAAVNGMTQYADDAVTAGAPDQWATPLQFLNGRADCEDYAIIKFWSLLELGFNNDQLRLAVVRDTRRKLLHAVVTVRIDGKTFVLDSLFDHVVEQRHILKYAPVYSANLSDQYGHIVSGQLRRAYHRRLEAEDAPRVTDAAAKSETREVRFDIVDWT